MPSLTCHGAWENCIVTLTGQTTSWLTNWPKSCHYIQWVILSCQSKPTNDQKSNQSRKKWSLGVKRNGRRQQPHTWSLTIRWYTAQYSGKLIIPLFSCHDGHNDVSKDNYEHSVLSCVVQCGRDGWWGWKQVMLSIAEMGDSEWCWV